MDRLGTGEVSHAGTFNGSVMAAAAVVATLDVLTREPPYDRVEAHGSALISGLRELAAAHDLPLRIQGRPVAFHASFGDPGSVSDYRELQARDTGRYAQLARTLARHGVWVAGRGVWYVSAAHGQDELTAVLDRVESALTRERP